MDYNFKVIAVLRNDLSDYEKKAELRINDLSGRLRLVQLEKGEYIKTPPNKGIDDFAAVYGFYHEPEKTSNGFPS